MNILAGDPVENGGTWGCDPRVEGELATMTQVKRTAGLYCSYTAERLCGNIPFESHVSIGPFLKLKFKSNQAKHMKGFLLQVTHSFDEGR